MTFLHVYHKKALKRKRLCTDITPVLFLLMRDHVLFQARRTGEPLGTNVAGEGAFGRVNRGVSLEQPWRTEHLLALCAGVLPRHRLCFSVRQSMALQVVNAAKPPAADSAAVRLVADMAAEMAAQVSAVAESHATLRADVELFPRVDLEVSSKEDVTDEALATLLADKRTIGRMSALLVLSHREEVLEARTTEVAQVGQLSSVLVRMHHQATPVPIDFAARGTDVQPKTGMEFLVRS